ncbi:CRISPR-associated protein GSU0054/csb2, Dpsyc system [Sanguibacter gelidistatuariae]|uniref:CRISPR-associated protein GSU0054/csb2, Dpsyc system n=1 Tax=Sanguibacter gelidistatuariae TaxID=1814289 RepID=A0A1G6JQS4_9MICO|nr:type I-U CRISPR-associated protein Csb2 [Sanguibacter gelidistatuariae]SDC21079.1 CRISPR-associated protein GSU0054/csb2, Dpsyc system [Sanguibacter gelidistatuariae]
MLVIDIHWFRAAYHGQREDGEPDWPPAPARLLGALLAGAHQLPSPTAKVPALRALRSIAASAPPFIDAPLARSLGTPATYTEGTWLPDVATAKTLGKLLDLGVVSMDSQSRVAKRQDAMALADDLLSFIVDVDLPADELEGLREAAGCVAYFGRSNDPADLTVEVVHEADVHATIPTGHRERWYPRRTSRGSVRGWLPSTLDWYDASFARTFGTDASVSSLPPIPADGYVDPLSYDRTPPVATRTSSACTVVPLLRSVPQHLVSALIAEVTSALEDSGQNAVGGQAPAWFTFAATVSGGMHDDGRCVGVGLAPRAEVLPDNSDVGPASASAVVERIVLSRAATPGSRSIVGPGALDPDHWTGPESHWFSATPLRGFPDERVIRHMMEVTLRERFGVGLTALTVRQSPLYAYEARWPNGDLADGLGQWWCELHLSAPIAGPLVLGAGTDHGFGLFHPSRSPS